MEPVFGAHANATFSPNTFGKLNFIKAGEHNDAFRAIVFICPTWWHSVLVPAAMSRSNHKSQSRCNFWTSVETCWHTIACVCECVRCAFAHPTPATSTSTGSIRLALTNQQNPRRAALLLGFLAVWAQVVTRTRFLEPDAQIRSDQSGESV